MRSTKLLATILAVGIVLSLTASAHAILITITPSSGPIGTHVAVTVSEPIFSHSDTSCTISSKPSGLISDPRCVLSFVDSDGQTASASFTVACAPAGDYTVTLTGNPVGDQVSIQFLNEGGSCPVGGFVEPVNTFAIVAPWLAVIGLIGCIGVVGVVVKKRRS
jgi:hypothetical protein